MWLYNSKFKKSLIAFAMLSYVWFLFSVIFIDNRWWWFVLELIGVTSIIIYIFKKEIWNDSRLKSLIRSITGWSIIVLWLLIISFLFVSPWWIFGFNLTIPLLFLFYSLSEKNAKPFEFLRNKSIAIKATIVFTLFFMLFSIPSYSVKSFVNPRESFGNPSSYYSYAVDSYTLYGPETTHDTEHVVPRAWFKHEFHYENDYVNLIHSNKEANAARKDLPYGNVPWFNSCEVTSNNLVVGYVNEQYFMPTDEYKGDVARIVLYMYVTYKDDGLHLNNSYVSLMKSWSKIDPVDAKERERNKAIFEKHSYHNRFVRNPWLVGFVV